MKSLPNFLTFSRIILSPLLLFTIPLSLPFYIIYFACGLSDVLDGFIARKMGASSEFGAKLDSIADLFMFTALLVTLFRVVSPPPALILWIVVICLIRLASILVVYQKHKTFAILHTIGNKLTGLLVFLSPIALLFMQIQVVAFIICLVATLSAIEELLINLKSQTLDVNRKSIFA